MLSAAARRPVASHGGWSSIEHTPRSRRVRSGNPTVGAGASFESCGGSFSSFYSCARLRVLSNGVATALSAAPRRTVALTRRLEQPRTVPFPRCCRGGDSVDGHCRGQLRASCRFTGARYDSARAYGLPRMRQRVRMWRRPAVASLVSAIKVT